MHWPYDALESGGPTLVGEQFAEQIGERLLIMYVSRLSEEELGSDTEPRREIHSFDPEMLVEKKLIGRCNYSF